MRANLPRGPSICTLEAALLLVMMHDHHSEGSNTFVTIAPADVSEHYTIYSDGADGILSKQDVKLYPMINALLTPDQQVESRLSQMLMILQCK